MDLYEYLVFSWWLNDYEWCNIELLFNSFSKLTAEGSNIQEGTLWPISRWKLVTLEGMTMSHSICVFASTLLNCHDMAATTIIKVVETRMATPSVYIEMVTFRLHWKCCILNIDIVTVSRSKKKIRKFKNEKRRMEKSSRFEKF